MPKIYMSKEEALVGRYIESRCLKCGKEKESVLDRFCKECKERMEKDARNDRELPSN